MLRALWFLIVILAVVFGVVWLIDRPGTVALDWQGYRLETSFAVMAAVIAFIALVAALAYRVWIALRRAPGRVGEAWRGHRRQKGYKALTRGMVAVAAGDADEARRQEKRAQVLLNEPPLTMLLSAQAAQLSGDEQAAENFFRSMTEAEDTEFLGVRGLLTQAMKRGDDEQALELARRAYRLRPKSDWVATSLFDLQVRNGQWLDAQITSDELIKRSVVERADGRRRKAVLALQQAADLNGGDNAAAAAKHHKTAYDLDPAFAPAVLAHARSLIDAGKGKRATDILEKAWRTDPHPDIPPLYAEAAGADDGLARMKSAERLAAVNGDHAESRIALAQAALAAQLWGEARKNLTALTEAGVDGDQARICRLWAELEEAEHGDSESARRWLTRASMAAWDPTWVCDDCGNAITIWSAICGNCGAFGTFGWRTPPHVDQITAEPSESKNLPVPVDTSG